MAVSLHGRPIICSPSEFARFPPPPGETCLSYTQDFIARVGGYVKNGTDGLCDFCQYANGDQFLASFNIFYEKKWFYFGILCMLICVNYGLIYFFSWLYLGGWKKISSASILSARKKRTTEEIEEETDENIGGHNPYLPEPGLDHPYEYYRG